MGYQECNPGFSTIRSGAAISIRSLSIARRDPYDLAAVPDILLDGFAPQDVDLESRAIGNEEMKGKKKK